MNRGLRSLLGGSPIERASWLRHLSLALAVAVAWAMRHQLAVTDQVLWILGTVAGLNLATTFLSDLGGWSKLARWLSIVFGMAGWTAVAFTTGGPASPFIAGLCLEIVFSALTSSPTGTLVTAGAATSALWLLAAWQGHAATPASVWLQTGFMVTLGAITFFASSRWSEIERRLSSRAAALDQRLFTLKRELEEARRLGQLGESAARLAHGLKSTIHGVRGFAQLLEESRLGIDARGEALDGLRLAIDRLETIALSAMSPAANAPGAHRGTTAPQVETTIEQVIDEVGRRYRGIRWVKGQGDAVHGLALTPSHLREVLLVLLENAAEASGPTGEVTVLMSADGGAFNVVVRDRGPGIAPTMADRLFDLGATTKTNGHGLGLFLARRLVESRGGRLTAAPAIDGGAQFSVTLPSLKN